MKIYYAALVVTRDSGQAISLPSLPASALGTGESEEAHRKVYEQLRQFVSTYPTVPNGLDTPYHRYPDGWYTFLPAMVSVMVAQRHFTARDTDIVLATFPKCGTTWLKALLYATAYVRDRVPDLSSLPAPRLLATHIPRPSLLASVAASGCKRPEPWDDHIGEDFRLFCDGVSGWTRRS
ncbi:hypothetical protein E2562_025804 [Oryza meyeriana var. granulata]|uniref:Sulfotransferase n=1 Tax=Oryza meyeriana var. granulata TaxID=110450 RepID=A0A6G1E1U9_9ORYZ|nr:hypothetical protein E2562_025804 [Oryza meyeriana var. granulata]